jgi:hypothetical protein
MTITYPDQSMSVAGHALSLSLDRGALIDLQPPTGGVQIEVDSGKLWVTQEGDFSDHLIGPGESFHVSGHGLLVLQALSCSDFRLARAS